MSITAAVPVTAALNSRVPMLQVKPLRKHSTVPSALGMTLILRQCGQVWRIHMKTPCTHAGTSQAVCQQTPVRRAVRPCFSVANFCNGLAARIFQCKLLGKGESVSVIRWYRSRSLYLCARASLYCFLMSLTMLC